MSDGTVADREVVDHPGAVGVVALDDERAGRARQPVPPPVRAWLDELPAGLLDVDGEPPLLAAQRELAEEAHTAADAVARAASTCTPRPGMSNEAMRIFLARGLHEVPEAERFAPSTRSSP